jgi:LPXTG-site transpeptidase (sortase) family protein
MALGVLLLVVYLLPYGYAAVHRLQAALEHPRGPVVGALSPGGGVSSETSGPTPRSEMQARGASPAEEAVLGVARTVAGEEERLKGSGNAAPRGPTATPGVAAVRPTSAFALPVPTPLASSAERVNDLFVPPPPRGLLEAEPGERWVVAPAIDLRERVVPSPLVRVGSGWQWQVPWWGVGHAERTGEFGQPGNVVLFGHVSTIDAGEPFRDLHRLKPGDRIYLVDRPRRYAYVVEALWDTVPEDVSAVQPTAEAVATLITCTGQWIPWRNDFEKRLVVRARLTNH